MAVEKESTKQHWERFWSDGRPLEEVYSNQERIVSEALRARAMTGTRVLEVGAGTGRDTVALVENGAMGVVLDYTFEALQLTRAASAFSEHTVHLVCADARAMPFREGTFGLVFHQGLLEHFRKPEDILAENARVLEPGGTVIVDVPQRYHAWTVLKKILIAMDRWFAGWETQFSPRELERMLEQEKLEVRRTYGDWMVPGLPYRALRVLLSKAGVRVLPMYPRGPEWWERAWNGWRGWLKKKRWALYTCFVIGVVAEKPRRGGNGGAQA
jgi:ubiquinone/menaquinone biosynthesis C-methylase UbiE